MTLDEIIDGILDAELGGADGYAGILVALVASIPDRIPDRRENYSPDEQGRIAFDAGQAGDDAWEWLRDELRRLAKAIRSSAELHI